MTLEVKVLEHIERSDFSAEIQDTLPYHYRLYMKKGRVFNANIKCFNKLKILDKEQSEESNR